MILVNKTCVPTELIQPLLTEAARSVLLRTDGVKVKLTQGKRLRGDAYSERYIRCVLPINAKRGLSPFWAARPAEFLALKVYCLFVHELYHVKDFKAGARDMFDVGPHDNRPCERRAFRAEIEAIPNIPAGLLVKLADWFRERVSTW